MFALVSVPIETPRSRGSLAGNHLCGVHEYGEGTYTTEGITKLCEALKESNVTVLKCAPHPIKCLLSCQRPLTHLLLPVAAWASTSSAALVLPRGVVLIMAPTPLRVSPSCAMRSRGAP